MTVQGQKGIALPLVLWVIVVLSALVLSFSYSARTEVFSTLGFREALQGRFLAEAGIQRGVMELFYARAVPTDTKPALEELTPWKMDGREYRQAIGDGACSVQIMDETGKISINALTDFSGIVLNSLLVSLGSSSEEADTIVDSILDWKDADEAHRLHGAESDYYQALPNPYKAKNADFETIEELLMVRGVTPEILYGTATRKGLASFVTVFSKTAQINALAAPREVLLAVPGMTTEAVDRIITFRDSATPLQTLDLQALIGDVYRTVAQYLGTAGGNVFTITSVGRKADDRRTYSIKATVVVDTQGQYRYLYYKSPAEMDR